MQRNQCGSRFTQAFDVLEQARVEWESLSGPLINGRKAISEAFATAIEDAINVTADYSPTGEKLEIDENSYEAALLFDDVARAYRDFKVAACAAVSLTEVEVDGNSQFWRTLNALREWFTSKYNYRAPLPIATLRQQGVSDEQIAWIYGWVDESGQAEVWRVTEEEAEPGTHYLAETWVHPAKHKRNELAKAAMATRVGREREYVRQAEFGKSDVPSLDELVRLGAPAAQIASLHGLEVEDAEALLRTRPAENEDGAVDQLQRDSTADEPKSKKNKG